MTIAKTPQIAIAIHQPVEISFPCCVLWVTELTRGLVFKLQLLPSQYRSHSLPSGSLYQPAGTVDSTITPFYG